MENIIIIDDFELKQLNRKRTIRIYVPPDYYKSEKRYPVIYMHDGQNLFDDATAAFGKSWGIAEYFDEQYANGCEYGFIVVGIDNGIEKRCDEYSPWRGVDIDKMVAESSRGKLQLIPNELGGDGFNYVDSIVKSVKPYIDSNFRTIPDRDNTTVAGSSMGGFISLVAIFRHPNVFSKAAAFSSAIWFNEKELTDYLISCGKPYRSKIYMDIGTDESSCDDVPEFQSMYIEGNKRVVQALNDMGYDESSLVFLIEEGAKHNEESWQRRFPGMVDTLLRVKE